MGKFDNSLSGYSDEELLAEMVGRDTFKVLGLGLPELLEFRQTYMLKGGKMPVSKERIKEVFS